MDQEKEYFDASAVNDLETARLALRWALERLHKMGEDLAALKTERDDAKQLAGRLTEEVSQKDQAVARWRETIKAWEASIKDHKRMEDELREELRKEVAREADVHVKEERHQLMLQIEALKHEIADK